MIVNWGNCDCRCAQALVQLLQQGLSALRRLRKKESVAAVSGCLLRLDPAVHVVVVLELSKLKICMPYHVSQRRHTSAA